MKTSGDLTPVVKKSRDKVGEKQTDLRARQISEMPTFGDRWDIINKWGMKALTWVHNNASVQIFSTPCFCLN